MNAKCRCKIHCLNVIFVNFVLTGGNSVNLSECSNSSWAEMESYVIGSIQMYPPTLATRQMLILRYLTPMGEYQEVKLLSNLLLYLQYNLNL